jgi:hypothetical protein
MTHQTTEALAEKLGIRAASIRSRCWKAGHYFGLRPVKLPNGRLLWPADAVDQILRLDSQGQR